MPQIVQDVLCSHGYYDNIVASFTHQIQSEYHGGNISMPIEGIQLEHFNTLPETQIKSSTKSCPRHAVFHYLLLDDSKQYAATNTAHSKRLIEDLKEFVLTSSLSTIWENTDGCVEQYTCPS